MSSIEKDRQLWPTTSNPSTSGAGTSSTGTSSAVPLAMFEALLPCPKKRLVLFDIDGTLVRCGRQVGPMFLDAMHSVFGSRGDWRNYSFSGKTDGQIVVELLETAGHERQLVLDRLPEIQQIYLPRVETELDPKQMTLLPGVVDLLEQLQAQPDTHLGLVTGNWERGGRAKLEPFGLNRFFAFGAFGEDGVARADLPPAAMGRACDRLGREFSADEVLIIGDTPNDVHCAHAHGIECLAVATGMVSVDELHTAGADWIVASLEHLGMGK